jgi:PTH1 family peptidyl-tRNA hydrolase
MTKLIVGLGNPGKEYEKTRHNVGFFIIDRLAKDWGLSLSRKKFQALFGEYFHPNGEKVILLKPQTFMNLSGDSVQPWMDFLKVPGEDVLVIHDELDLPLGRFKAQWEAGPAGHNGVRSIIQRLGHQRFNRLRVGVGHPGRSGKVVSHVLSPFSEEELKILPEVIATGAESVKTFIEKGLDPVAQIVNRRET